MLHFVLLSKLSNAQHWRDIALNSLIYGPWQEGQEGGVANCALYSFRNGSWRERVGVGVAAYGAWERVDRAESRKHDACWWGFEAVLWIDEVMPHTFQWACCV